MKRLSLLLGMFALGFLIGCASDGKKATWAEFKKDMRGDNMKMSNDFSGLGDAKQPSSLSGSSFK